MTKLLDKSSFALIRTNPKLTTNVKVIVDTKGGIFLESINANDELAKSNYKGFRVSPNTSYEFDLHNFYNKGKTPPEIIFENEVRYSDSSILNTYNQQYETTYIMGSEAINSKIYDEEFGVFAPIWLEENIPSHFIILRVDGPVLDNSVDETVENALASSANDPTDFFNNILKNATIIKTFDLSEESPIGKYIRKFKNNDLFPEAPLNFTTDRSESTIWNGIDIRNGGFSSKSEFLYKQYVAKDTTIIENDYLITKGFERNSMAVANILNLQFLFDDTEADDFTINRYFGFYVNPVKEGTFRISGKKLFNDADPAQLPNLESSMLLTAANSNDIEQTNENGIKVYIDTDTIQPVYESELDLDGDLIDDVVDQDFIPTPTDASLNTLFYVKDSSGNFHNVKNGGTWTEKEQLRLARKTVNWKDFTGIKDNILSERGFDATEGGKATMTLTVNDNPPHGDRYFAGIPRRQQYKFTVESIVPGDQFSVSLADATNDEIFNDHPLATAVSTDANLLLQNLMMGPDTATTQGWKYVTEDPFDNYILKVSDNVMTAIEKTVTADDDDFVVNTYDFNEDDGQSIFTVEKTVSASVEPFTIAADSALTNPGEAVDRRFCPDGTTAEVAKAMAAAFNNIDDKLFTAVAIDNKVVLVANAAGTRFNSMLFGRDSFLEAAHITINSNTRGITHPDFLTYYFEGGTQTSKNRIHTTIEAFSKFLGDNRYLRVIPNNSDESIYAKVAKVNNYIDEPLYDDDGNIIGFRDYDKLCTVSVETNREIYTDSLNNIYLYNIFEVEFGRFSIFPIKDMDFDTHSTEYSNEKELDIETSHYIDYGATASSFEHEDIEDFYLNQEFGSLATDLSSNELEKIGNEYERLNENSIKELALPSRVSPFINKWVYKFGKDTRDNDYRLNVSEAFGVTNFSPSADEFSQEPYYYTHEWYYLQGLPWYYAEYDSSELENVISYFNDPIDVTETGLLSLTEDYFENYFIVDWLEQPEMTTQEILSADSSTKHTIKRQLRYGRFRGGSSENYAEAFFRGVKIRVKERVENEVKINYNLQNIKFKKNTRFNDYRFSAVLIPHSGEYPDGTNRQDVDIEFIENRKYKNITMLIYVNFDDILNRISRVDSENVITITEADFIDRTMLYAINSKIKEVVSANIPDDDSYIKYDDVNLSGAIDIRLDSDTNFLTGEVFGVEDEAGDIPNFVDQIIVNQDGEFNQIQVTISDQEWLFNVSDVISNNELTGYNFSPSTQPITLTTLEVREGEYLYLNGGYNFWVSRLNEVSFAAIADKVNNGDPVVSYKTILADGTILENQFVIELNTASVFVKPSYIKSNFDPEKPVKFNLKGTLGFRLEVNTESAKLQPLYRHGGTYVPKFRDIICFEDPYILNDYDNELERDAQIRDLMRYKNTQIRVNEDLGILKNFYYHKVNDNNADGILELSEQSSFKPLYPLIGEIAIDKKDTYIFKSNWDADYFQKHVTKLDIERVIGTRGTIEEKSFYGSKIMKIADNLTVETFNFQEATSEAELLDLRNDIRRPDNDIELIYFDGPNSIIIDVFLEKRLIRQLSESGIKEFFQEYVNPKFGFGSEDSLDDDIESYIKLNILPRYLNGGVNLYVSSSTDDNFNEVLSTVSSELTDVEKVENGLQRQRDVVFERLSVKSNYDFRVIYNKTRGLNYIMAPSVEIIKK